MARPKRGRVVTKAERPTYDMCHRLMLERRIGGWWAYTPHDWELELNDGSRIPFDGPESVRVYLARMELGVAA